MQMTRIGVYFRKMINKHIIITDYQPRGDAFFTNSTLIKSIPLILKPGQRFKYDVDYSPNGEVGVQHNLRINYVTNAKREKLYSDLTGVGSDAQLSVTSFTWTERVVDKYQTAKGVTKYYGKITIQNMGNTPSYIEKITLLGSDTANFYFVEPIDLRNGMLPNDKKQISETVNVNFQLSLLLITELQRKQDRQNQH